MNPLAKIALAARPGPGIRLRKRAYGRTRIAAFLRDVIGLANAPVDGPRYIVVGTGEAVPEADFSGTPPYAALIREFVEPILKIRYEAVPADTQRLGVFEIGACHDQPYMMRIDHSDLLRRGDAFVNVNGTPVRMGRNQLQGMFASRFSGALPETSIEVGFPDEIVRKQLNVSTIDLDSLPSAVHMHKTRQVIDAIARARGTGSTSMMARLTHARLFGSDSPYRNQSTEELMQLAERAQEIHGDADAHYLFETSACKLQLVVLNHGNDLLRGATLSLSLPHHAALFVATALPRAPRGSAFEDRSPLELEDYPPVAVSKRHVRVAVPLDDVPPGTRVSAFRAPLRINAGSELKGRRIGIHYLLSAGNLRKSVTGRLRLHF